MAVTWDQAMKLIVGLGNPGREYVGTRHNIGFEALDALARRLGWIGRESDFDRLARTAFFGLTLDGMMPSGKNEKVLLLKPMTYMNLSGRAVQAAMSFYQLPSADVMVVLDDMALPAGKLRIRAGGSSGGHNGLADIEKMLGTSQYPRMRIGIDAPPPAFEGREYVLGKFSGEQRKAIEPALERAGAALTMWIDEGIEKAMSRFNAEES
jgi:PTH1 family peptidyl-tRNA hydrolase